MEEWRDIPGTEYQISSDGRVRNTHTNRILIPWKRGKYLAVNLGANNPHYIHKLVAGIFLSPVSGYDIDHINRNKHDNRVVNLRYVTKSQNRCNTPALPTNKIGEKNISKKMGATGVTYCVRVYRNGEYVFIKSFDTLEAAIAGRDNFLSSH